jgi:hypothetical protein
VSSQLGNLGGSYAAARDAGIEQKNQAETQQFDQAQKLRDYLETQRMDNLYGQVQKANLARQQAGQWDIVGQPMQTNSGGYGVVERNTVTGDIRTRPLPADIQPRNEDEVKWDQFRSTYKQAFGTDPSPDLKTAFFDKLGGVAAPKMDDFTAWREAFKVQHGRYPNATEISEFHRAPRANIILSGDALDNMAEAVAGGQTKLPSGNLGVQVLNRLKGLNLKLPTQLTPSVQANLSTRADALSTAIDTIERIKPNLPLLQSLPAASLVDLAQHPDSVAQFLTRMLSKPYSADKQAQIAQLAGDLRSLQEQVNILRQPLGATGFRGKEGWEALQMQIVKAMGNPQMSAVTLNNTESTMHKLLNSTLATLGEAPASDGQAPTSGVSPSPPPGATMKVPGSDGKLHWSDGAHDLGVVQ